VFTSGTAKAIVAGEEKDILAGDLVIVPAGTKRQYHTDQLRSSVLIRPHRQLYQHGTDAVDPIHRQVDCDMKQVLDTDLQRLVYAPAEHAPTSKHKSLEEGEELEEAGKDEPPSWAKKGGN
jgi:hypothetical protein